MRWWWGITFLVVWAMGSPALASDGKWSLEPFETKYNVSVSGTESARLDWGADYDYNDGQWSISGWGNWPGVNYQLKMDWTHETGGWDIGAWGILEQDERYNLPSIGFDLQWEKHGFSWETNISDLKRLPFDPESPYGYDGWTAVLGFGYELDNGCRWSLGVEHKNLDYPDNEGSSARTALNGSFRWKVAKSRWTLTWEESSTDYPDKPMSNSWSRQYGLGWTCPFEAGHWTGSMTAIEKLTGDGLVNRKEQFNAGETLFLKGAVWSWKLAATWQEGSSWIEDVYDLTSEAADDWGVNGQTAYGLTWSWQREFGPHSTWKLGGGLKTDDTEAWSWSCHSENDFYLGEWRMRLYLSLTGDDGGSRMGAWLKMTYYFD